MSNEVSHPRIGIFGGTFNPIHVGHLLIAELALESLSLDEMRFVPAAVSPLKTDNAVTTTAKQRVEMVRLAIGGNPGFVLDDREVKRGGTSYTIDTLRELQSENQSAELYFLMGADSLVDFHRWREPEEICKLAQVIVVQRGGHAAPEMDLLAKYLPESTEISNHLLEVPAVEISSTDLRERIQSGRSTRYQMHPAVSAYIVAEGMYR